MSHYGIMCLADSTDMSYDSEFGMGEHKSLLVYQYTQLMQNLHELQVYVTAVTYVRLLKIPNDSKPWDVRTISLNLNLKLTLRF